MLKKCCNLVCKNKKEQEVKNLHSEAEYIETKIKQLDMYLSKNANADF